MTGKSSSSKQALPRSPDSLADVLSKSPLLLSSISLPADYFVSFVKFEALDLNQGHNDIEFARRELVQQNSTRPLIESALPFVQLTKDQAILWVFCVDKEEGGSKRLQEITFENLQVAHRDAFQYREVYPCSSSCSVKRAPCPDCSNPPPPPQPPTPLPLYRERSPGDPIISSRSTSPFPATSEAQFTPPKPAACLMPRQPLREPLRFFLTAVRDRFVDDFCQEAASQKFEGRSARAFRGGFLLCPSACQSDWGDEWDSSRRCRPLVHCRISLALHTSDILITYKFSLTYLSPLLSSLPLAPGSPVHLLPFSTPAYFVNTYTGPISALIRQFEPYLAGLGAGRWTTGHQGIIPTNAPEFVIVWVKIQNLPDEDLDEKGFFAIWPSRLCVSVLPVPSRSGEKEFAYRREMQHPLPELPPALQASPVPTAATVHGKPQASPVSPTPVDRPMQSPILRSMSSRGSLKRTYGYRPSFSRARSSLTSQYLHSFRRQTLSRPRSLREIRDVAQNVGKFVDSVAREREKERERIKRERDAAQQAARQNSDVGTSQDVVNDVQQKQTPMEITVESPMALNANLPAHAGPSSHPAYPSPPDDPPSQPDVVPKVEDTLQPFPNFEEQKSNVAQSTTSAVDFSSFENLEESWMANTDFMMELGMDFNMNVGMNSSAGVQDGSGDPMKLDIDSFALTDDDFNFFDDPPTSAFPASATMDAGNVFSAFDEAAALIPSPNVPMAFNAHEGQAAPLDASWVSSRGGGFFASPTVSVFSHNNPNDTPAPDLVPASPSKSLATQSGPATPNVAFSTENYLNAQSYTSTYGLDQFDPVQFAPRHSLVDAKYTAGKFFLPSPSTSSSSGRSDYLSMGDLPGWPSSYSAVTDWRIAIRRRLLEMKSHEGEHTIPPSSVLSTNGSSDWTDLNAIDDILEEDRSESDESEFEGSALDIDELTLLRSRTSTPLPSYLPPGASLLATRFTHSRLVPFSQVLPISAPSFDEDDMDMNVHVVPTPVSPSTLTTSPGDEMKRHLAVLRPLCEELLDNPVWASAWRASLLEQSQHNNKWFTDDGAWFNDVRFSAMCFQGISSTRTPTSVEQYVVIASPDDTREGHDAVCIVEPNNIVVGKSNSLIQISPPALRFWDKLGLSPRSGKKDITAFVVHNDQHDITDDAASWLADISRLYSGKAFGDHVPGNISACKEDGILVIQFEQFRTNMAAILQLRDLPSGPLVFYIITTVSMLSTTSTSLRQLFTGIKHLTSSNPEGMFYFHLIPDHVCKPSDCHYSKEIQDEIVLSVYNRIKRPTYKMLSRQLQPGNGILCKNFKAPAFTLARPLSRSVSLEFQIPERISSVSDRHMLLHVGFCVTENKCWLIAMCLDERQETQEIGIWKLDEEHTVVPILWGFAMSFAAQASVEWRVVFAKLGPISEPELEEWNARAVSHLASEGNKLDLHASLVCCEDETWLLDDSEMERVISSHKHTPESPTRGSVLSFQDSTFLLSRIRCPLFSSPDLRRRERGHISKDEKDDPSVDHDDPLRPLRSSILINYGGGVDQPCQLQARYLHLMSSVATARSTLHKTDLDNLMDISRNYCDLSYLEGMRQGNGSPSPLPSHLAAVALVKSILDLSS
ncbi:hypothetical protein SCHPADRAFT_925823 [Schizopora paradoxa]|uniref:Mediator of RNA polymerase II transcription subunit 13 n=1 Tax=Schizopora paradoxa TaxID=27342 RepID=A0A0H2SK97_9AGAM|nr:hypothetical protein SCHPADRAFT_925823 [Schizopora paradoxa]